MVAGETIASECLSCYVPTERSCPTCGSLLFEKIDIDGSFMTYYCKSCEDSVEGDENWDITHNCNGCRYFTPGFQNLLCAVYPELARNPMNNCTGYQAMG